MKKKVLMAVAMIVMIVGGTILDGYEVINHEITESQGAGVELAILGIVFVAALVGTRDAAANGPDKIRKPSAA